MNVWQVYMTENTWSERLERVRNLPAESVPDLMTRLGELSSDDEEDDPLISFRLRSGAVVTGHLLDHKQTTDCAAILVQAGGTDSEMSDDVTYLSPSAVEAVTIHDAGEHAHHFAPTVTDRPLGTDAPGKLSIRRSLSEQAETISAAVDSDIDLDVDWDSIPETDDARWNLQQTIESTMTSLESVTKDDLGREALRENVDKLRFADGDPGVTLTDRTLIVKLDPAGGRQGRLSDDVLTDAINAAL
jgi:hypothetical protein